MQAFPTQSFCVWTGGEADIDALGLRGAFDMVFAHMTPALSGAEALEKLLVCTKRHCLTARHVNRQDPILKRIYELVGAEPGSPPDIPALLKGMGYNPSIRLREDRWHNSLSLDAALSQYMDRASLAKELTPRDQNAITDYITGLAVNGVVENVTRVTIEYTYCDIKERKKP